MLYFQKLARLLFKAGEEMGNVDVNAVEEILGISMDGAAKPERLMVASSQQ